MDMNRGLAPGGQTVQRRRQYFVHWDHIRFRLSFELRAAMLIPFWRSVLRRQFDVLCRENPMKRGVSVVVTAILALSVIVWTATPVAADEPALLELSGDLGVHDPVMIKDGQTYYVFYTGGARGGGGRGRGRRGGRGGGENAAASGQAGGGEQTAAQSTAAQPAAEQPAAPAPTGSINMLTSPDMKTWSRAGFAIDRLPDWTREVPNRRNPNDAWAPDISHFNGKYHLYYSISSFGSQDSAIGLATNKTLDPKSPDFKWEDGGKVVESHEGDAYNCIDPNLVVEDENNAWLSWGSFWGGIMMRRVDPKTGRLSDTETTLYKLARRTPLPPGEGEDTQRPPQRNPIEGAFIVRHGDYWYLFVSWDFCCRGARSDYKVAVGRSPKVTGPYFDKEGKNMSEGGGVLILEASTDNWHGAGHNGFFRENGVDYMPFHAYRATAGRGGSQLFISTVVWEDGWPRVAKLP
jgi:arabinan endo-1,5-alpha-L-arabinosidase